MASKVNRAICDRCGKECESFVVGDYGHLCIECAVETVELVTETGHGSEEATKED